MRPSGRAPDEMRTVRITRGFTRHALPDTCPICYTVADFCRDHPRGVYVLGIGDHVVCAVDGDWYDAWDSSAEIPAYYWERED